MIKKLKNCLKKCTLDNGGNPCLAEEMKSSLAGLYKRGLIETRMENVDGKELLCIYITERGKNLLNKLNE